MKVSSVRGLVLGTPAVEMSRRFYSDVWGLTEVAYTGSRLAYFTCGGADHWVLGLEQSEVPQMSRLRLGVDTSGDIDCLAERLVGDGLEIDSLPAPLLGPGDYYGFTMKDNAGRLVEISALETPRSGARTDPSGTSHIVLNCADVRACVDFYERHFGFEVSDWYEGDGLIFMRCNSAHHSIALAKSDRDTLNHVAYQMQDLESVVRNSERIKHDAGQNPIWGPGRHGPGGNVFSYFKDPAGFVCEYTAELIQIGPDDKWVAKAWTPGPNVSNVWQTGGAPPAAAASMSGAGQFQKNDGGH
ncbi:hypothetical protein SPH9361_00485 [Sphingobium sp. CECT 9361]|nr:hypothetical protein SPH9361_00485 [Sphingobium sp. CECT 9361]